jgi:SOS-response transcriptional repressor LexA
MVPEFREGDIVIVDPDREVESGSFVVAQNTLGQATIKQLIKDNRGVFLRPLNSAYPVMDVTGQELPFMGRVVEKQKRY